jgi:hypothetical protein
VITHGFGPGPPTRTSSEQSSGLPVDGRGVGVEAVHSGGRPELSTEEETSHSVEQ